MRSSSLGVGSTGTERLIELTKAAGGDTYLSGDGAEAYQEDERFAEAGIELERLGFRHPEYVQPGGAQVPGMSAVDALMSCGGERAGALLR